jgi:hypothetical protein
MGEQVGGVATDAALGRPIEAGQFALIGEVTDELGDSSTSRATLASANTISS